MQLFLAVHHAHGGEQHAAGLEPHHLARRQVDDRGDRLADELFRLIVHGNAGEDLARRTRSVVQLKAQQLLRLFHRHAPEHAADAEVALFKLVKEYHLIGI